jgi:farnesyl-diphosphate farnesyltransferase
VDTARPGGGGVTVAGDLAFAHSMLPKVSRTFARAIELLPPSVGEPVRLSYLLCRVADTMEDAPGVPARTRRDWLLRFGSLLAAGGRTGSQDPPFGGPASVDSPSAGPAAAILLAEDVASKLALENPERALVKGMPHLLHLLSETDERRRRIIERWTSELALGMARFVRLEEEGAEGWTALATCEDLDAYEYYVAGTVGCLLDELIGLETGPRASGSQGRRRRLAVAFGQGLQGTNILQDLSDDRARGWSYIPEEIAARHGTATIRLHEPSERIAAVGIVREMAERALRHLDSGLEFVLLLPRLRPRIRLFCLWPLLLAIRTLARLVSDDSLFDQRVRISRAEVGDLTREATWRCLSNTAVRKLYQRERDALTAAMRTVSGDVRS